LAARSIHHGSHRGRQAAQLREVDVKRRVAIGCALAIAAGACNKSKTAPSPTVTSIAVTSASDLLFIGASETFTATATLSDGSTQNISTAAWGTNEQHVVSVESSSGRVTGVGSGQATVFVDYQGQRGTRSIRGLPNYQGSWSGSYAIRSCQESGTIALAEICRDTFAVNRVLPLDIIATQTRDAATAQLFLGSVAGSGTGPIQLDGRWLLAATARSGELSIDTVWTLHSATSGRSTGAASFIVRFAGLSGDVRADVEIRDLNRDSADVAFAAMAPGAPVRSPADLATAMRTRR
jgi:hypothetical protein